MGRSRSRSPASSRGTWGRHRGGDASSLGFRVYSNGAGHDYREGGFAAAEGFDAEAQLKHMLDGPMLSFKQFVLRNPDGTSQDVLNEGYKKYLKEYRAHHASRFFEENHHLGFMHEAYNPNLLREQFVRCRDRAQHQARVFLQRWEEGGYRNLKLEVPVGLLAGAGDVSPLLLEDWPRQVRVSTKQQQQEELPFGVFAVAPDVLLLPHACCLEIHHVDPRINKFDVLKALEKRGALYAAMVSNAGPTSSRTAHVFFASQEAADEALAQGAEFTIVRLCGDSRGGRDGVERLMEFSLRLQQPAAAAAAAAAASTVFVSLTPPVALSAARRKKDSSTAWQLIRTLDGQLDVCAADAPHPLEEILDGIEDPWLRLDLMLTYLRHVHCVCYYSGKVYDDPQQLHLNATAAHLRPVCPPHLQHFLQEQEQQDENAADDSSSSSSSSSSGISQQQQQWAQQLDQRLQVLLHMAANMQQNLPPPLDENESPIIQSKWNAFCQEHTSKDAEGRYRCTLCQKLFKAPSFVHLHHRKKHELELIRIINKYVPHLMKTAYMNDPNKHITLPKERQRHRDRDRDRERDRERDRDRVMRRPPPPAPGIFMPGGVPPPPFVLPPPPAMPHVRRQRDWDSPYGPGAAPLAVPRPTTSYDDL